MENIPLNHYFKSPNISICPEYNENKNNRISSLKPKEINDYIDVLKPFPHVMNMIIDMKEKHQHIVSDLDVLTNQFKKLHHFICSIQFSKEHVDTEKDAEVEKNNTEEGELLDEELLESFNEDMDI